MAISDRLTKLSEDITSAYKSINDLGGTIPAHKNTENISVAIDSIYNRLPKVSGTGSNITLTPTLKGRLGSVINGDTFQQTYSGKNLFDKNNANIVTATFTDVEVVASQNGKFIYIPITGGETYTVSKIVSARFRLATTQIIPSVGVSVSSYIDTASASHLTINTSDTANYLLVYYYLNGTDTIPEQTILDSIQIEKGSTATSYEPYVGGQASPNPSYPQEIQSVEGIQNISVSGKNLAKTTNCNITDTNYSYIINNGDIQINTTTTNVNFDICGGIVTGQWAQTYSNATDYHLTNTDNGNYVAKMFVNEVSGTGTANCQFKIFTNQRDINTYFTPTTLGASLTKTVSLQQDEYIKQIAIWVNGSDSLNLKCNIQLEKGSTATDYQLYQTPQTQEINLENIKLYNGDYITGTPDNWSVVRENGVVVLDGTESMGYNSSSEWLYVGISQFTSNYKVELMKSNYFTYVANMGDTSVEGFGINNALAPTHFVFRNLQLTSKNDWTTWLSTHNTEIVYKLTTPTTTPITDTYLISQLNALYNAKSYDGQTNITVNGQLPMILDVSALKDEI